jgi:hypothetical protein
VGAPALRLGIVALRARLCLALSEIGPQRFGEPGLFFRITHTTCR